MNKGTEETKVKPSPEKDSLNQTINGVKSVTDIIEVNPSLNKDVVNEAIQVKKIKANLSPKKDSVSESKIEPSPIEVEKTEVKPAVN